MENNPGILNQLNSSSKIMYNNLTADKLSDAIYEILSSIKEKENLPPYGYIGHGLYHIGNGVYCNKKGFDEFENSFYDAIRVVVKSNGHTSVKIPSTGFRKLSKSEIRNIKNYYKKEAFV